ncbi:MAG: hypothetical protein MRZ79_22685 [Bacteroidia bacterium]|nr:hypothetical protein [Bacteroidia bacterium]
MNKKYPYGSKWAPLILGLLSFLAASIGLQYFARTNDEGINIMRMIYLPPSSATIFFWVLFGGSILLTLMTIMGIYFRAKGIQYLEVKEDRIIIPGHGFIQKPAEILFSKIQEITEVHVYQNTILNIETGEKKRSMLKNYLSKKSDYEEIRSFISKQAPVR